MQKTIAKKATSVALCGVLACTGAAGIVGTQAMAPEGVVQQAQAKTYSPKKSGYYDFFLDSGIQSAKATRNKVTIKTKGTIVYYKKANGSHSKNLKKGTYTFKISSSAKFYTGMDQKKSSYAQFKKYFDKYPAKKRGFELNLVLKNGKAVYLACS